MFLSITLGCEISLQVGVTSKVENSSYIPCVTTGGGYNKEKIDKQVFTNAWI